MNALAFRRLLAEQFKANQFEQKHGRYYISWPDLIWVTKPERAPRRGSTCYLRMGAFATVFDPAAQFPEENSCHLQFEYFGISNGLPDFAREWGYKDSANFYKVAFTPDREHLDDHEHEVAVAFVIQRIAALFRSVRTVQDLASALAEGTIGSYVLDKRLGALVED